MSASRSTPGSQTLPVASPTGRSMVDDRAGGIDEHMARDALKHALFGRLPKSVTIGRYALEREIGSGGLGVVFAARDPQLDRVVAIKLVRTSSSDDRGPSRTARLAREAQTLARVNHPNVVTIYDVGAYEAGDEWPLADETPRKGLYIVMEYVLGIELRAWLRDRERPWQEVLRACLSAGRGLAAAHAVGLVHRDFKPSNVLVGDDGRVRVLDFGLARAVGPATRSEATARPSSLPGDITLTHSGSAVGTPAYMAPEQHSNGRTDERADQFAFCVTLWEALYGERPFAGSTLPALITAKFSGKLRPPPEHVPVPDAIRVALERGLQHEAGERWPHMDALLDALERVVAPRSRRPMIAVAGIASVVLLLAWLGRPAPRRCEDGAAAIDGVWNDQRRNDLRAAVLTVDVAWAPAAASQVEASLDAFALRWRSSHADVCALADTASTFDAGIACLRDDLRRTNAFLDVLLAADARVVERAVENAAALPDPQRCAVRPGLQARIDARADAIRDALAASHALLQAGRYDPAYDEAVRADALATKLGDPLLRAEALVQLGKTRAERGDWVGAESTLADAYWLASEHGHDAAAAEAALQLVVATSEGSSRYDDAERWLEHARSIDERRGAPATALARLQAAASGLAYRRGDTAAAVEHARESVRLYEADPATDEVTLSVALGNLGGILALRGEYEEAEAIQRRVLSIRERALGADHPEVAQALHTLAACVAGAGRPSEALPLQERAVQSWERSLGDDHPFVAMALNNLGTLAEQLGDEETALRSHQRALAIREARLGRDHPDVGVSLLNVAVVYQQLDRIDDARSSFERALEILVPALGDAHDTVAYARMAYGSLLRGTGDRERARELLEQATAVLDATPGHPHAAMAHAELGGVLLDLGRPADAIPWLERALGESAHGEFGPLQRATARFTLARALWDEGRARARAQQEARDAMRDLANAELPAGRDADRRALLVEIEAWLAR